MSLLDTQCNYIHNLPFPAIKFNANLQYTYMVNHKCLQPKINYLAYLFINLVFYASINVKQFITPEEMRLHSFRENLRWGFMHTSYR